MTEEQAIKIHRLLALLWADQNGYEVDVEVVKKGEAEKELAKKASSY